MKQYVKPKIYFESYALSESIARACSGDEGFVVRNSTDAGTGACYVDGGSIFPGVSVFTNDNTSCKEYEGENYCITAATSVLSIALGSA